MKSSAHTGVDLVGHEQGLPIPLRKASLGASLLVKLHVAVDAVHPLVIPHPAHLPQPLVALPESPAQLRGDQFIQGGDDLPVAHPSIQRRPVIRRPRQPGNSTSALHGKQHFFAHDPDRFAFGRRR
jgi:hypothetical protein